MPGDYQRNRNCEALPGFNASLTAEEPRDYSGRIDPSNNLDRSMNALNLIMPWSLGQLRKGWRPCLGEACDGPR